MIYKIKSLTTYEFEADSDEEALSLYDQGIYDQHDIVDESFIELGYINESNEYIVLQED